MAMATYEYEDISRQITRSEAYPQALTLDLGSGQTSWDPSRGFGYITGPARVTYELFYDGGYNVTVEEVG